MAVRDEMKRLSAKYLDMTGNDHIGAEGLATIMEAVLPMVRQAVRDELNAARPLEDQWYEPSEVSAMSGGRVAAETVRNWFRWGQIDGESDGRQVRLFRSSVEELRQNKWHPVRQPDPAKLPPSKRQKWQRNQRDG